MALGKEEAEGEASENTKATKAQSYGNRWSCREEEPEQPLQLEAEGGPAWRAVADPGYGSEVFLPQGHTSSQEPVAGGSKPALNCLLQSVESQESTKMEESKLPVSQEVLQSVKVLRATALCSGHDADTEDDLPRGLGLSQQPRISGFPFLSQWNSVASPGAPQLSSGNVSATSMGSSLQDQQEKAETQSDSFAKVTSLNLVVPQTPPVVGPGSRLQWSSQPMVSGSDATGLGRRQLSFQAEYWACVLPDSLPPSPDRHSPLWNPNKEYEDLLDYTYPLRPGPQLPKQFDHHVVVDPVLQDSGIDLDSFSVSPASTLKSPSNVSPNCSPAEASALPLSGARKSSLKFRPLDASQKQGSIGLASWSQLTLTPRTPGSGDNPWERRKAALKGTKNCLPMGKHLGSPQLRTRERGQPLPRPEGEKRASQNVQRPTGAEPGWKPEEELESDDEYLALPTRLTQVSSLVSYLGAMPTFVSLPTGAAEGQSSLEVSDSDGPASYTPDSSQRQHPSGVAIQEPKGQDPCCLHSLVCPQDSIGKNSLLSSSGLLKTHPSLPAMSDRWPFTEPCAGGQKKASLVQCVQTFCCHLEELIRWLYNVTDVTDLGSPPGSSLTGLKSSLQLYRQFKKDVYEHQSLTENVLEKGELLLQCLLDNTPVLKDVLGRIEKQSGELESHADRLYDSILASLDMLAGCTLIPDNKPTATKEYPCEGV